MTFQEARDRLLRRYDEAVGYLRTIVSDPAWCNEDYKPYKEHTAELVSVLRQLRELNEAESVACKPVKR